MGETRQEASERELERARRICLQLLAHRPRSEWEFRSRLTQKGFDKRLVGLILEWLRSAGLADDREFARWWVESRKARGNLGRRGVEWELRAKGLERPVILEALAEIDEPAEIRLGLEAVERRRAGATEGDKARLLRWLRRRGFSPGAIQAIMRGPRRPDI